MASTYFHSKTDNHTLLFSGCAIIVIIFLWWGILAFHDRREETALQSWMDIELQMSRSLAKAGRAWLELRLIQDDLPTHQVEPELLKLLIEPVKLLKSGYAWICHKDYFIYHHYVMSRNRNTLIAVREVFESEGAHHYEVICDGVSKGIEGKDWIIWSPEKGREYSAWSPIMLQNDIWTVGISTPESEILELAGIKTQNEREIISALIITFLLILILILLWRQKIHDLKNIELLNHSAEELSASNKELMVQLTERRRVETELEKVISSLEEKNRQIEQFTCMVSHDLKSPLITISAFLGVLEQNIAARDMTGFQQSLLRIQNAATRMQQLLDDVLDIATNTQIIHQPEDIPLSELAKEAAELTFGQIMSKGVSVTIQPNMPVIRGDRPLLLRVMQNLIDNAVKFMGDQPDPLIEISAEQTDDEIICSVKDNGIGINPKYYHKLFNIFERLEIKTEGTGIGLAIVKKIILEHGGRVWVESPGIGYGSTFYFALPRKK